MGKNRAQRQDELFDIVDSRDRVIRQATRREVHASGLLHRAVHVLVYNQVGDLLLQKRSLEKDSAPGKWTSSCSGHLDAGENYDAAAVRELDEELGIVPGADTLLEWLFKHEACEETGNEFICVYRITWDGEHCFNPDEISETRWMNPESLRRWLKEKPETLDRPFKLIYRKMVAAGH